MTNLVQRTKEELERGLEEIRRSPTEGGTVRLIVRRPHESDREVLDEGELDVEVGLRGDGWSGRPSSRTADRSPHPDRQITLMSSRVADVVAGDRDRWILAGDQLFVDLDLSSANCPPGTTLELGTAVLEVTAEPHTGCKKFAERFGHDALRFVSSPVGRELNLRGIYARVVRSGSVRVGDAVRKEARPS